jgi:methylmalonyl-CoA/ethylmalonyl-CoA epimerase
MRSCRRGEPTSGSSIGRMQPLGVHHIGVAVADLDEAVESYSLLLGGTLEHRETLPDQGVEAASMLLGGSRIELLAPTDDNSPVGRFLVKRGPGMHHIAYEVEDVGKTLADLAAAGTELIDVVPRLGLFGLQVAFVHPDAVHGVLTEVVSIARST